MFRAVQAFHHPIVDMFDQFYIEPFQYHSTSTLL